MSAIKEIRKKMVSEETIIGRCCDFCKNEVDKNNYFKITVGHYDWGNDSCESVEVFDACTPECVLNYTKEYVEQSYNHVTNTMYIEIEHKRHVF